MTMKTYVISILLLTVVSGSALGDDKKLQEWIGSASWSQGVEYCNRELVDDISRRPDLRSISSEYLARIATYCAALASGKGDELSAGWWWYTAASLDLEAAQRLLPEMRKLGLLRMLPVPRMRATSGISDLKEKDEVRLLSGKIVKGIPPRALARPEPPAYMSRRITGVARAIVAVELVVSKNGLPQQPLLMRAEALPPHVLYAYHYLGTWRFEPAKVNDETVESIYSVTITIQGE